MARDSDAQASDKQWKMKEMWQAAN